MSGLYERVMHLIAAGAIRNEELFVDKMAARIDRSAASADEAADELCDLLARGGRTPVETDALRESIDTLAARVDALTRKIDGLIRAVEKTTDTGK